MDTLWYINQVLFLGFASAMILFGLDDLLIDCTRIVLRIRRKLAFGRQPPWTVDDFARTDQRPCAILVPAWREATVIGQMLRHLRQTLDYGDYRVYVGVYPNDPSTHHAALSVVRAYPGDWLAIHVLSHSGPTTKADCLYALWSRCQADGRDIDFIVLHDAEDVVSPGELHIFNHLIDRAAMIQLPVLPLPHPEGNWIADHYLDEFSDSHGQELVVREQLMGAVPCAGVGCAFSVRVLQRLDQQGLLTKLFQSNLMTEDYALSLLLADLGEKTMFAPIGRLGNREPVATKENFPSGLRAAVRQKTRWIIGNCYQAALLPNPGRRRGWRRLYGLWRDRRGPLAVFILWGGLITGLISLSGQALSAGASIAPAVMNGLIFANLIFAANRLTHRWMHVFRWYGPGQAMRALPRYVLANIINLLASVNALIKIRSHRHTHIPFNWAKTHHKFPENP